MQSRDAKAGVAWSMGHSVTLRFESRRCAPKLDKSSPAVSVWDEHVRDEICFACDVAGGHCTVSRAA